MDFMPVKPFHWNLSEKELELFPLLKNTPSIVYIHDQLLMSGILSSVG